MTEERDSSVYSVRTIVVHMDWRFIPGTQVKFIYKTADDTLKSRNCILALEKTRNTRPKNVSLFFFFKGPVFYISVSSECIGFYVGV